MKHEIVNYGHAALREKAEPVRAVTDEIRNLAEDMLETMYANQGVGLAAEQVGRREAICVIDVSPREGGDSGLNAGIVMPLVLINPEIKALEGEQCGPEGCLSFPEIFVNIKRAQIVTVAYTDLRDRQCEIRAEGLLSRAIQHEIDHLNAVLLVDRMSPAQKVANAGKLKRLKKGNR